MTVRLKPDATYRPLSDCLRARVHQLIVWINVVDGLRRHEPVLHEHRRRYGTPVQDVERERDDVVAVLFGEIGKRSDETRAWLAELGAAFDRRVLAHDRAVFGPARLLKRAQRTERA